ncbi:MAG: IS5 family transposase IS4811 [Gammaproteobacteria bacterium]|nr:IS5 family transposase IS4811 [Gammaproteobacteria bacterium]
MGADTLSDVLRTVRLTGAVFFDIDASSPWVAEAPPGRLLAPHVMPGAQHLIEYHVLTRGSCWAGLIDEPPARLEAGDVIVFPHGDAHVMSSAPGMRAPPDANTMPRPPHPPLPIKIRQGGGGPDGSRVICGFLGCDARPFNPLLATLPRVLHVSEQPGEDWLSHFVRFALREANQQSAGGECMLARMSELMFVEVVRRYLNSLPPDQTGWLAGLRDRHVGRALSLLHERPAHSWTLDGLARQAGTSRSVLAERFQHFVGQPPMHYLTHWRMQVAAGLLVRGTSTVAGVATEVGYDSEAAFSRAFKKVVGVAPATWRRRQAGSAYAGAAT